MKQNSNRLIIALALLLGAVATFGQGPSSQGVVEHEGHLGAVMNAQFLPDSGRFVSVSTDQTARLCDSETGALIRAYDQHTAPILSSAVSANGTVLVTGGQDNTVRVWSLPPVSPEVSVESGQAVVSSMTASNEVRMLVTAGNSRTVDGWSTNTSAAGTSLTTGLLLQKSNSWVIPPQSPLPADSMFVTSAARSDGLFFAVASDRGEIVTLTPELQEPIGTALGHVGRVSWMQSISSGQQLLTAGDDGMLRVWQWNPVLPVTLLPPGEVIADCAQIPQQNSMLLARPDGRIQVVALDSGTVQKDITITLKSESGVQLRRIVLSADGQLIAAACSDGSVKIVQLSDGQSIGELRVDGLDVRSLQFHPDRQRIAVGAGDGTLRLWNLPVPETRLTGFEGRILAMDSAPNEQWLATLHEDRSVRIWNLNGQLIRQLTGHEQPLACLDVRPEANALATGDESGIVRIWAAGDGSQIGIVRCSAGVVAVRFSPDQKHLVTATRDGVVAGWLLPLPMSLPKDGETPIAPAWKIQPAAGVMRRLELVPGIESLIGISETSGLPFGWKPDGAEDSLTTAIPGSRLIAIAGATTGAARGSVQIAVEQSGAIHRQENLVWQSIPPKRSAPVRLAELSPDGTILAVAGDTTRVTLCDVRTAGILEEIDFGVQPDSVAWVNDEGSHLAIAGAGVLKIVRRSLNRSWEGPVDGVTDLLFHSDQQSVFAAGGDGSLRLLRLSDGAELSKSQHHTGTIHAIALTNNNQMIWTAGEDRKLILSSPAQAEPVRTIETPVAFTVLTALNDGSQVAGAGDDGLIRLYSGTSGYLLESFPISSGVNSRVSRLTIADNGQTYVGVTGLGEIRRNRVSCQRVWPLHSGAVVSACAVNGGGQVLSIGADRRILLTETTTGNLVREYVVKGSDEFRLATEFRPITVTVRPDNQRLAVGGADGSVLIFDINKPDVPLQRLQLTGEITAMTWSGDNQRLAVTSFENELRIFGPSVQTQTQTQPQTPKPELELHQTAELRAPARQVSFSSDNSHVWISLSDGRIEQWRYSSPVQLRQFNHGGAVYSVAVNRAGTLAVSGSADQTVRIWDLATGQQRSQMNGHQGAVHCVRFSSDETTVISAGADGTLRVWDAVGGRPLRQLTRFSETMYSLAVHPTLPLVAAAGADRMVHLLDSNTGQEIRQLAGHKDYVHSVAFSPGGERLASYGYAGSLKLWKTDDGQELSNSRIGRVGNGVEFSGDGQQLILAGGDGKVRISRISQ